MPTLPLPTDTGLAIHDYSVATREDVLAAMPQELADVLSAPVRDALADLLLGILVSMQEGTDYAAAQANIDKATEQYLDALAEDRSFGRATEESNTSLRTRVLNAQEVVTPRAIAAAVDAVLALHTEARCHVSDAILDRWYIRNRAIVYAPDDPGAPLTSVEWSSHVGAGPEYPTRKQELMRNDIGGAMVFENVSPNIRLGRHLVIRIPDLDPLDESPAFMFDTAGRIEEGGRPVDFAFFVGNGTSGTNTTFLSSSASTARDVYQAIANTVGRIIGHSIRWSMFTDAAELLTP